MYAAQSAVSIRRRVGGGLVVRSLEERGYVDGAEAEAPAGWAIFSSVWREGGLEMQMEMEMEMEKDGIFGMGGGIVMPTSLEDTSVSGVIKKPS